MALTKYYVKYLFLTTELYTYNGTAKK